MSEERRADRAYREKAEGKVAALKLSDKWGKPTNAGNGRIRLKHESGVTVEGSEQSLYAVVMAGKVAGYDFTLKQAIQAVEESAKTVDEPKPEPEKAPEVEDIVVEDEPAPKKPKKKKGK